MAFELTKVDEEHILSNSIERVINTSIKVVNNWDSIDADVNRQDWEDLKWTVCKLWDRERDRIHRERFGLNKPTHEMG